MIKRSCYTIGFALLIAGGQVLAQAGSAAKEAAQEPLAPLAWFIGGTWGTEVKDATDGHMVHVVNRPVWSPNHQAIIFNVNFDDKPHYYGFYAYNPVTKRIDFYYTSSAGELTTGNATPDADGKTLRQEFDILHTDGTASHLRSTIQRDGNDAYWLTVSSNKDGNWAQLFRIRYVRKAE